MTTQGPGPVRSGGLWNRVLSGGSLQDQVLASTGGTHKTCCASVHSAFFRKTGRGLPGLKRFMVSLAQLDYIFGES